MALGPLQLNIIDLGGSILLRRTWNTYLKAADLNAIIFVIDASDETRFGEAKQVLHVCAIVTTNLSRNYYRTPL